MLCFNDDIDDDDLVLDNQAEHGAEEIVYHQEDEMVDVVVESASS